MTDEDILNLAAQSMTSGVKQTGATFHLPESMLIHFARLAYNRGYQAATDRFAKDFSDVFGKDLQK